MVFPNIRKKYCRAITGKLHNEEREVDTMEQNEELQGCMFAVPSKTLWTTSKPLVHKKKQHSEEYLRCKKIYRENDFSVYTDPETGEIVCKVIPKDMDAEQKKAERAAQLTALADLMDSKGYTVEDIEKLMSTPKPTVEVEDEE